MEAPAPISEPTTSVPLYEEPRQQEPRAQELRPASVRSRAQRSRGKAGEMHGALLGAGLTLGLTFASRFISGVLRRKNKQTKRPSTVPSNASTPRTPRSIDGRSAGARDQVNLKAFGSPTPLDTGSPRFIPTQHKQEKTREVDVEEQAKEKSALPPGQLKQQMQLLQEAQEENARLQQFMKEYMATSDKVKVLEQENNDLKTVMTKLETQLNEIKAKTVITNGAELSSFKDAVKDRFPAIARSVCSDLDFGIKDNGSVDGSASVIDVGTRKKMGALSQLFAWANQQPVAPKSAAPSQPPTPRRTRSTQEGVQSSDVVQLLNAFSAGGVQF